MTASERMSDTRLLYPKENPRSHTMICELPVERALSTTFCISHGERNCPFLMLTGFCWDATFRMKFVCRQRKAGVCSTSTTADTSASGVSSCTSVRTGTPISRRTRSRALRPASKPRPRKLAAEERLALSKEALKMNGMPRAAVMSRSRSATSRTSASLSTTQGPAIKKNGRSGPTSNAPSLMQSRGPAAMPRGIRAPPVRTPQTADGRRAGST